MDMDYIQRRFAEELERADNAACDASRAAHRSMASLYYAVIEGRITLPSQGAYPIAN